MPNSPMVGSHTRRAGRGLPLPKMDSCATIRALQSAELAATDQVICAELIRLYAKTRAGSQMPRGI